jgi:hypothetical protein
MNTRVFLMVFLLLAFSKQDAYGQLGFSNEIGLITGPVAFYSDYGVRNDFETNSGNVGFGIGLIHYINFAYRADCNCYTREKYWNDHFKVRTEIDFHKTNFSQIGKWVDPDRTSTTADQLRGMRGSSTVFEIGSQLEYFPLSIRDYMAGSYKIAPFISLGVHWVNYDPEASTDFGTKIITSAANVPDKYIGAFQQEPGTTWALVSSVGIRYSLGKRSDLMLDAKWQYYFSNWVDGLNPSFDANNIVEVPENRANDWIFWLNIGYVFYLN